ncbi:MAG: PKD domain-containing protein, partial [Nitrospirota bacterium]
MGKKVLLFFLLFFTFVPPIFALASTDENTTTYLQAVINTDEAIEVSKSTIFDASQSFIPYPDREITYNWDFGDGNKNEGIEVLHAYIEQGPHTVTLTISDSVNESVTTKSVFLYRKLIVLISDQTAVKDRIEIIKDFAEKQGVYIQLIDSFGSSTEFISEEILTKKLTEESTSLQKANQIIIWTKENAGLNAISRYIQSNIKKLPTNFSQKTILDLESSIISNINRIQRQFDVINPKSIIVAKESAIYPLIESSDDDEFIDTLEKGGYEYELVNEKTGKLR